MQSFALLFVICSRTSISPTANPRTSIAPTTTPRISIAPTVYPRISISLTANPRISISPTAYPRAKPRAKYWQRKRPRRLICQTCLTATLSWTLPAKMVSWKPVCEWSKNVIVWKFVGQVNSEQSLSFCILFTSFVSPPCVLFFVFCSVFFFFFFQFFFCFVTSHSPLHIYYFLWSKRDLQ